MVDNQPCNRRPTPRPCAERIAHEAAGIEPLSATESLSRLHPVRPHGRHQCLPDFCRMSKGQTMVLGCEPVPAELARRVIPVFRAHGYSSDFPGLPGKTLEPQRYAWLNHLYAWICGRPAARQRYLYVLEPGHHGHLYATVTETAMPVDPA